jgi:hypothetical protein
MTRIYCILAMLLMCSACSVPGPAAPGAGATAAPGASPSAKSATASPLGLEAHVILDKPKPRGSETPGPSLKPRYADKAAFLADVQAMRPSNAIMLDGSSVWDGFGPPEQYHTNGDGSISQ